MNADETPESIRPQATAGVRRVGCKRELDSLAQQPQLRCALAHRPASTVQMLCAKSAAPRAIVLTQKPLFLLAPQSRRADLLRVAMQACKHLHGRMGSPCHARDLRECQSLAQQLFFFLRPSSVGAIFASNKKPAGIRRHANIERRAPQPLAQPAKALIQVVPDKGYLLRSEGAAFHRASMRAHPASMRGNKS